MELYHFAILNMSRKEVGARITKTELYSMYNLCYDIKATLNKKEVV